MAKEWQMSLIMDLWHTMGLALLLLNPSACQSHLPRNLTSNRGVLDKMQVGSKKKVSLKNKILFRNFYCVYLCAYIHVIAGILWKPEEGIGNFIGGVSPSKWKAPPEQWLSYEGKGSLLLYLPEPVHLPLQLHPLLTWDSIFQASRAGLGLLKYPASWSEQLLNLFSVYILLLNWDLSCK